MDDIRNESLYKYIFNIANKNHEISGDTIYNIIAQFNFPDELLIIEKIYQQLTVDGIIIIDNEGDATLDNEYDELFAQDNYSNLINQFKADTNNRQKLSAEEEKLLGKYIFEGQEAKKSKDNGLSSLEIEESIELGKISQKKMVDCNYGLVFNIAKQYYTKDIEFMDLVSEGCIGLIKAAEKFDYRKGFKFSTYAYNWIRQYISMFIKNNKNYIRLPMNIQNDLVKIKNAKMTLEGLLSRNPTFEEIAEELGSNFSAQKVKSILDLDVSNQISLDAKVGYDDESRELAESIADESSDIVIDDTEALYNTFPFNKLTRREVDIVYLFEVDKWSLNEISDKFNISVSRVRQIKDLAIRKIISFKEKGE